MKRQIFAVLLGFLAFSGASVRADSPEEERRERYADRVDRALERDPVLRRFDLDADSKGERTGYIELEGQVRNASQRNRALSIARREAPGYRIVNRIRVAKGKRINGNSRAR